MAPYNTRVVKIGGFDHVETVMLGGGYPVVIQTMWKDRLSFSDIEGKAGASLVARIGRLKTMGCGLLRFAVPDLEAAEVLGRLAGMVSMPLAADIHFDYKIALRCMDFPIAKIRINPGNIGGREKVEALLSRASEKGIPIRIGVNAGSLPLDLRKKIEAGMDRALALVEAADRELAIFREFGFWNVLVSMKASSIADTIKANRLLAEKNSPGDAASGVNPADGAGRGNGGPPLHIGVTEAGPLIAGVVRNTAALLRLLEDGIGDTLRVSLSDTMENEVIAGREILAAAAENAAAGKAPGADRLRRRGVTLVSCPRCGRNGFDTHGFTGRWLDKLYSLDKDVTVAIMGCVVNGPGEAKHADLGVTGAGDKVLIFRRGKVIRTINAEEADRAFEEELYKL
ncbi:MAG: (E)-4-hydroxy-3-methylbut-2-enyl-diphosphate synthase [Treponema sp.]|jgi:(E)-4-hydroxy-3-methylbut-2-enyl-diphosphate synthase|nr:(E)-4-hydroxy-3-methylbut-2-enyl-diphosphate synthase [Treponema sp.]